MVYSKTGTDAQRGRKISILRDAQNLIREDPGKPNLTAEMTLLSVGNQTWWPLKVVSNFYYSVIVTEAQKQ